MLTKFEIPVGSDVQRLLEVGRTLAERLGDLGELVERRADRVPILGKETAHVGHRGVQVGDRRANFVRVVGQ